MRSAKGAACFAVAFGLTGSVLADVRLASLFSDHAVFQQGVAVPVWGWADPGEAVTVAVAGQTKSAKAGPDGAWRVTLDALRPGEALALAVKGKNTLTVQDVLVGEVWIGSGQSNMGMTVSGANDFDKEKAEAALPQIRMFTVDRVVGTTPQAECKGRWVVCAPDAVGGFSATAYFFGKNLHRRLNVPVGLINSSWGGTPVEAWISADAMAAMPNSKVITDPWAARTAAPWDEAKATAAYDKQVSVWKERVKQAKAAGKEPPRAPKKPVAPRLDPHHPANLYNGMIAPLIPYAVRGAVWYQGESNAHSDSAHLYGTQLETLIADWRARWGYAFPFAWVQLPNFKSSDSGWALVREGMLQTLKVPNTGMAVAMGLGESNNIHPKNKQEVGRRLALWAFATVYSLKVDSVSGPLPAGHTVKGGEVVCTFTHADGGLVAQGGELQGFVIAGADQKWVPAQAKIVGDTVVVSSPDVKAPVAVRYAWSSDPVCNLFNGAGLSASPFRTDAFDIPVVQPAAKK